MPREMEGDFIEEIDDFHKHIEENYPQGGKDFVIPTRNEMEGLLNLGIKMKLNELEEAESIIAEYDFPFEVVHYTDTANNNQRYRMLREKYDQGEHKGWGIFVWAEKPQLPWTIQVTHPIFDEQTHEVGSKIFVRGCYSFHMHGTHRYSYPSAGDQEGDFSDRITLSDPSGADMVPMLAFQLAESRPNNVFFQIHGFTKQRDGRGTYPGVVVSEGSPASPGSIRAKALANELNREGLRAGLYHGDEIYDDLTIYDDLGAETNRGSAWTDVLTVDPGHFMHLEIETIFRLNSPTFTADAVTRAGKKVYPHMDTFKDPIYNMVKSPSLDSGSEIADDWEKNDSSEEGSSYEIDNIESAQLIRVEEAIADSYVAIEQVIPIDTSGIPYKFTVFTKTAQEIHEFNAIMFVEWLNNQGEYISSSPVESYSGEEYFQLIGESIPPSGSSYVRIVLAASVTEGSSGLVWFKDCRVYKREDKYYTRPLTCRFHDADPTKIDVHFSAPLKESGSLSDWDSDLQILSTSLKDHGYTVELEVSGTQRTNVHYFSLQNGIEDLYHEKVRSNRVYATGISEDDMFSGENMPTSRIRKNLEMFPIQDMWDRLQTSGANIIRTRNHHPYLPHQQNGAIIGFKKRSDMFIFCYYQKDVEPLKELWFRADVYIPDWYQQQGRSVYIARISESEDNILDGIRLNLTYDEDGELYFQLRNAEGGGTARVDNRKVKGSQWQTIDFCCRVGQEAEQELWIDGEQVATMTLPVDAQTVEHVRVGTTYASEPVLEKLEFYMKGVKISKTRFGIESQFENRIFKPMLQTELIEIDQQATWTNLIQRNDLTEIVVAVPVNLNKKDVKVRVVLQDDYGKELDRSESSFVPSGIGTVTINLTEPIRPGTILRIDAEDTNGYVGETNVYNYIYIPPIEEIEINSSQVVAVVDQNGLAEALTDVYDFERSEELNGDYKISFSVFESLGNFHSFPMLENENIVHFEGDQFRLKRVNRLISVDTPIKEVEARHTFFDIIDYYQYETIDGVRSIEQALAHALGPAIEVEFEIEGRFDSVTLSNFGDDTCLALFQDIMELYGAEFKITGAYKVLIKLQIGRDTDVQFRHKNNIETFDYYIDTSGFSTYIEGYGKRDDETGEYAQTAYYTSPRADKYRRPDGSVRLRHAKPIRDGRYENYASLLSALQREIQDEPMYSVTIEVAEVLRNLNNEIGFDFTEFQNGDSVFVIHEPLDVDMDARVVRYKDYPLDNISPVVTIGNFKTDTTRMQSGRSSQSSGGSSNSDMDVDDVNLSERKIRSNDYVWMDQLGIHQENPDESSWRVFHGPRGSIYQRMLEVSDEQGRKWIEQGTFKPNVFSSDDKKEWLPDVIPEENLPDISSDKLPRTHRLPSPNDPPMTEVESRVGWWVSGSTEFKSCQVYGFEFIERYLHLTLMCEGYGEVKISEVDDHFQEVEILEQFTFFTGDYIGGLMSPFQPYRIQRESTDKINKSFDFDLGDGSEEDRFIMIQMRSRQEGVESKVRKSKLWLYD